MEWCCHPVALARMSRVAPSGRRSNASTRSCFDPALSLRFGLPAGLAFFFVACFLERTLFEGFDRAARAIVFMPGVSIPDSRWNPGVVNWVSESFTEILLRSYRRYCRHGRKPAERRLARLAGEEQNSAPALIRLDPVDPARSIHKSGRLK